MQLWAGYDNMNKKERSTFVEEFLLPLGFGEDEKLAKHVRPPLGVVLRMLRVRRTHSKIVTWIRYIIATYVWPLLTAVERVSLIFHFRQNLEGGETPRRMLIFLFCSYYHTQLRVAFKSSELHSKCAKVKSITQALTGMQKVCKYPIWAEFRREFNGEGGHFVLPLEIEI